MNFNQQPQMAMPQTSDDNKAMKPVSKTMNDLDIMSNSDFQGTSSDPKPQTSGSLLEVDFTGCKTETYSQNTYANNKPNQNKFDHNNNSSNSGMEGNMGMGMGMNMMNMNMGGNGNNQFNPYPTNNMGYQQQQQQVQPAFVEQTTAGGND